MAFDQWHRSLCFLHPGGLQYAAVSRAADGGDDAAAGEDQCDQSRRGADLSGWESEFPGAVDQSVWQIISSAWGGIFAAVFARSDGAILLRAGGDQSCQGNS